MENQEIENETNNGETFDIRSELTEFIFGDEISINTSDDMSNLCHKIFECRNWRDLISYCMTKIKSVHIKKDNSNSPFHNWMMQGILQSGNDEMVLWLFEYSLAKLPKGIFDPRILIEFLIMYFPYHKNFEMFVDFCSKTFDNAYFLQNQICTFVLKDDNPKFKYLEKMGYDCYAVICPLDGDKWDVWYSPAFKQIPFDWSGVKNPIRLKWINIENKS